MTWKITGAPGTGEDLLYSQAGTPTLDLRFASSKSLNDNVSGQNLVTFTRASGGTYVDSQGVIRNATTNLLLRSEEFDNAVYGKSRVTITTNAETAPSGFNSADKLVEDTSPSNFHGITQAFNFLAAPHTFSVYLKAAERTWARIFIFDLTNTYSAYVNLATGAIGTTSSGATVNVQSLSNGWLRLSLSAGTLAATGGTAGVRLATGDNGENYTGDGTSGIYLWGAQLEQSSTVGEYIPTGATINSAPRFDHNPTTGESLGLLVEEQRTNLLLRSEEFDNASWGLTNILAFGSGSTVDSTASPDGLVTADKVTEDLATGFHRIGQLFSHVAGTAYTFTVFVKAAERTKIYLQLSANLFRIALFDLATGATFGSNANIVNYGNGWYRCSLTSTATTTSTATAFVEIIDDSGNRQYTGDGTSGIYLWGAQLEAGAFPTSYIKTEAATATRAADVASISGSNLTSWFDRTKGTVFAEFAAQAAETKYVMSASNGSSGNNLYIRNTTTGSDSAMASGGATGAYRAVVYSRNNLTNAKHSFGYEVNNFDVAAQGAASVAGPDTSCDVPVDVTRFDVGSLYGTAQMGGTIKRLTYWPQRLGNEVRQRITQ